MCRARRLSSLVNANLVLTLNAASGTWYLVPGTWYQLCYVWYVCMYVCLYVCMYLCRGPFQSSIQIKTPSQDQNAIPKSKCHFTMPPHAWHPGAKCHCKVASRSKCHPKINMHPTNDPGAKCHSKAAPRSKYHPQIQTPSQNQNAVPKLKWYLKMQSQTWHPDQRVITEWHPDQSTIPKAKCHPRIKMPSHAWHPHQSAIPKWHPDQSFCL